MEQVRNWFASKWYWLKTGDELKIANGGKPIEEIVIRYKNFYFMIDMDVETGDPTGDFCWSQGTAMTRMPIREFYTATRKDHK